MAVAAPSALVSQKKKHFIGVPAPLGYVAGVGRGYVKISYFIVIPAFAINVYIICHKHIFIL